MRPSGVAARPCIILPPSRSITLPNRASPTLSPPHCLSSRIRVVGIARRSSSQFSSPHHQSPKQMTRSRRRYPPRHRSSPRRIQISGYFYRCAPRVSPCSSTTLDLRRSQISARTCAQNVERRKCTSRVRDRERERLFCSRVYYDSSIALAMGSGYLPLLSTLLSLRSPEFDKPRFVITRIGFSVSRVPVSTAVRFKIYEGDREIRREILPPVRRDFFPPSQ